MFVCDVTKVIRDYRSEPVPDLQARREYASFTGEACDLKKLILLYKEARRKMKRVRKTKKSTNCYMQTVLTF